MHEEGWHVGATQNGLTEKRPRYEKDEQEGGYLVSYIAHSALSRRLRALIDAILGGVQELQYADGSSDKQVDRTEWKVRTISGVDDACNERAQ